MTTKGCGYNLRFLVSSFEIDPRNTHRFKVVISFGRHEGVDPVNT